MDHHDDKKSGQTGQWKDLTSPSTLSFYPDAIFLVPKLDTKSIPK